jgi:rare lipoprotein A
VNTRGSGIVESGYAREKARKGAGMTKFGVWRLSVALGTVVALSACQSDQQPLGFLKKKAPAGEAATTKETPSDLITVIGGDQDVEAPEIFKLTDKALWDGRPSLGGVWVAHTSVKDPERVIISNPANGKSVIGALFRREIDNPGPKLQLSSDAAEALGLLAGQPATLSVVALRRIEAPTPAAPAPAPEPAEGAKPANTTEVAQTAAKDASAPTKDTMAQSLDQQQLDVQKTPKKGFFANLFKKKPAAAVADAAIETPPAASTIDQSRLDPVVVTAEAAINKATGQSSPAKAAAPAPASELKRAYVQIGIFSVEANAKTAAAQMKKAGMAAIVKPDTSQGKTFWRVIIGPAASVAARDALAAKVKNLGYPDAYPVSK